MLASSSSLYSIQLTKTNCTKQLEQIVTYNIQTKTRRSPRSKLKVKPRIYLIDTSSPGSIRSRCITLPPNRRRIARGRVYTYDVRDIRIPRQGRILPASPGEVLVEIVVGGIGLRGADIGVASTGFAKGLREAFLENIDGADVLYADGLCLGQVPAVIDDVVPGDDVAELGVACEVLQAGP